MSDDEAKEAFGVGVIRDEAATAERLQAIRDRKEREAERAKKDALTNALINPKQGASTAAGSVPEGPTVNPGGDQFGFQGANEPLRGFGYMAPLPVLISAAEEPTLSEATTALRMVIDKAKQTDEILQGINESLRQSKAAQIENDERFKKFGDQQAEIVSSLQNLTATHNDRLQLQETRTDSISTTLDKINDAIDKLNARLDESEGEEEEERPRNRREGRNRRRAERRRRGRRTPKDDPSSEEEEERAVEQVL